MISIRLNSHDGKTIPLGQVSEFVITRSNPEIQTRTFIIHQKIHYLKPVSEWTRNDYIHFFPEAPGDYTLACQWSSLDKEKGWVYFNFQVLSETGIKSGPVRIRIDNHTQLWGVNEWEVKRLRRYEEEVFNILYRIIQPGQAIYDIGANLGQYSIWFSRAVRSQGHVYCFEANPVCVYLLQVNLDLNQANNCEIFPVALSSRKESIDFTINYGNSALGITRDSPFYAPKIGHEIIVMSRSLDELVVTFNLRRPDLIKIDVEGAEDSLIKGMENTLIQHQPIILIEVHGQAAANASFKRLDQLGFFFLHIASKRVFNTLNELLEWFPEAVEQFICFPAGKDFIRDVT